MRIDGEIPLRQPGEMANGLQLGDLGQPQVGLAREFRWQVDVETIGRELGPGRTPGTRMFENQGFSHRAILKRLWPNA